MILKSSLGLTPQKRKHKPEKSMKEITANRMGRTFKRECTDLKKTLSPSTPVTAKHLQIDPLTPKTLFYSTPKAQKSRKSLLINSITKSWTPPAKPLHHYSGRFIPSRKGSPLKEAFSLDANEMIYGRDVESMHSMLLQNEILGKIHSTPKHRLPKSSTEQALLPRALFYNSPVKSVSPRKLHYSSPIDTSMLRATKPRRKIPTAPFKILDAPALQDDYYLNLLDWSITDLLGVGLGPEVYLWSAKTSQVTKLCELEFGTVTSVQWDGSGEILAVGNSTGEVQLWDACAQKVVHTFRKHSSRVGVLSWNQQVLTSGSRDRTIALYDIRHRDPIIRLIGHKQEVCGMKWSPDKKYLASGGNDNKLYIWDPIRSLNPVHKFTEHTAAVKALAWSPHKPSLLASGGGTADRCIRLWDVSTASCIKTVDTGSQVCNLVWSKNSQEIVSTHGYSMNDVVVWNYPCMNRVTTLTGHSLRVLYLSMSPDGQSIVTGAGDETLRFWNVFPPKPRRDQGTLSRFEESPGINIR